MKDIITAIVCVLILTIFIVQFTAQEVMHTKLLYAESAVNTAVEVAKQDGCFTTQNQNDLKARIAEKCKCEESEVIITCTTSPVLRGEVISYEVSFPIRGVVGAGKLLGMSSDENTLNNTIKGTTTSEYVVR